jgi:hypothetical protein
LRADEYNKNSGNHNGTHISAVLFLLTPRIDRVPDTPHNLPYVANAASFPAGSSSVPLALLLADDFSRTIAAQSTNQTAPIITWIQQGNTSVYTR